MTEQLFMTVRQVAQFFQVTEYTVRAWLNDPDVPLTGTKPAGGHWRIATSEVHQLANLKYGENK